MGKGERCTTTFIDDAAKRRAAYKRLASKIATAAAQLALSTGAFVELRIAPPRGDFSCPEGTGAFVLYSDRAEEEEEAEGSAKRIAITEATAELLAYRGTFISRKSPNSSDPLLPPLRSTNKSKGANATASKNDSRTCMLAASMALAEESVQGCVQATCPSQVALIDADISAIQEELSRLQELASSIQSSSSRS